MFKASEKAYDIIRANILSGVFPLGGHLKEEELTKICGVSRTPIREALLNLSADYYVEIIPNRGTFVTDWTNDDVEDIFNMRMLLEGYAAQKAAVKATPEQIEALMSSCDNIDKILHQDGPVDAEAFLEENRLFHHNLWKASGSERLAAQLSHLVAQPVVDRTAIIYTHRDIRRSNEHHKEIVEAITAKNSEWSRSVMHSHIMVASQIYAREFKSDTI